MYIASIVCNIAKSHWKLPTKWFYYYLLDGDLASNNLSWQWVCGANSSKKYYANQEISTNFALQNKKTLSWIKAMRNLFQVIFLNNLLKQKI